MILRVWALYNRSRLVLGILLMVYIPENVLTIIVAVIANTPENIIGMYPTWRLYDRLIVGVHRSPISSSDNRAESLYLCYGPTVVSLYRGYTDLPYSCWGNMHTGDHPACERAASNT